MTTQHPKIRTILISILCLTVIFCTTLWYVFGQTPTDTFWITGGIYPGAPSYTIWKEGSYYFAKDSFGLIPSWGSGTNATQIGENVIDALPSDGGSVLLKAGTFTFSSPWIIERDEVTIIMEQGVILSANLDGFLFHIGDGTTQVSKVIIAGGEYIGTTQTNGFFLLNYTKRCYFEKMDVHGLTELNSYAVKMFSSWDNHFNDVTIWNVQNGYYIGGNAGYFYLDNSYTSAWNYGGGATYNYEVNLDVGGLYSTNSLWEGNVSTSIGIHIGWVGGVHLSNCAFEGGTHLIDINATDSAIVNNNVISGGYVDGDNCNIPSANKPKFRWVSSLWQQSGEVTVANGDWIAHHLQGEPSMILVSPTFDGVQHHYASRATGRNETMFQVAIWNTADNSNTTWGVAISWYAEYQP